MQMAGARILPSPQRSSTEVVACKAIPQATQRSGSDQKRGQRKRTVQFSED